MLLLMFLEFSNMILKIPPPSHVDNEKMNIFYTGMLLYKAIKLSLRMIFYCYTHAPCLVPSTLPKISHTLLAWHISCFGRFTKWLLLLLSAKRERIYERWICRTESWKDNLQDCIRYSQETIHWILLRLIIYLVFSHKDSYASADFHTCIASKGYHCFWKKTGS